MESAKIPPLGHDRKQSSSEKAQATPQNNTHNDAYRAHSSDVVARLDQVWSRPVLMQLRWQLPIVILSCAVLPAAVISPKEGLRLLLTQNPETFGITTACSIIALLLIRRLEAFPGITSLAHVIPSALAPYLGLIFIIASFRLEYSRPYLLASSIISIIVFTSLWAYLRTKCKPVVYVLPGAFISPSKQLKLRPLTAPLKRLARHSIVVADLRQNMGDRWDRFLLDSALAGIPVYHSKSFQESLTGKVEIEHLSENNFGSVIPSMAYMRVKRFADIVLSFTLAPMIVPLFIIIALAIKLDTRGSILFLQPRMGFRGRPFVMVKFRTMIIRDVSVSEQDRFDLYMTREKDIRVTRVGRILRRYRLDELPQVLNVLRGEMSWIGPRPEAELLSGWYDLEIPFYGYRHIVRPGITGWAQVNQGHVVDVSEVKEKLYYDFYYIKHFSVWLDALIVVKTFQTLVTGRGVK